MIKLNIEMNMAHLIGKIARSHDNSSFEFSDATSAPPQHIRASKEHMIGASGGYSPGKNSVPMDKFRLGSIGLKDFDASMSEVADYPSNRYAAWVTSGPCGPEPNKGSYVRDKRTSRLSKKWRKTKSDDTMLLSSLSFSGISKDTDVTVVAEDASDDVEPTDRWREHNEPV
jgi:hypothetical protein